LKNKGVLRGFFALLVYHLSLLSSVYFPFIFSTSVCEKKKVMEMAQR